MMIVKELNLEDEHEIPAEENNCFGFDPEEGKCTTLTTTKLTDQDRKNCGTLRCPFYKPKDHVNSIKHESNNAVFFETREEYIEKTGYEYLTVENFKLYENYPHASPESVEDSFKEYIRANGSSAEIEMIISMLPYLKKSEIIQKGAEYGIFINTGFKRNEMAAALEEGLCALLSK